MKKLFFSCLFLLQFVQAQTVHYPPVSYYPGLGAYSKKFTDIFSFTSNPAALAQISTAGAGVFTERKFLLEALTSHIIAVSFPLSFGGIGITGSHTGYDVYKETHAGLAFGKSLGSVAIGAQFNFSSINMAGYGTSRVIHFDVGTIWHVSEKLHTGIRIKNPAGGKFGNSEEKLALAYTVGLGYEVSEVVFINTEIVKEEDRTINIVLGLHYMLDNKFYLRAGIASATATPWIGAGLAWKKLKVDITSSYHPQLGISPGLSLIFSAKTKEE